MWEMASWSGIQRNASAFLTAPLRASLAAGEIILAADSAAHVFVLSQLQGRDRVTARETLRHVLSCCVGSSEKRRVEISRWPSVQDFGFGLRLKSAAALGFFAVPFAVGVAVDTAKAIFGFSLRPSRRVEKAWVEGSSVKVQFAPRGPNA